MILLAACKGDPVDSPVDSPEPAAIDVLLMMENTIATPDHAWLVAKGVDRLAGALEEREIGRAHV